MDLARTTSERYRDLLKTASVSDQDAAEKVADLESKTATYESASARVRQLEDLMSFNRLSAPFNGRITLRNTDVGDLVTAGVGHELFRLADTSKLRVFIRVPQSMAFNVSTGQTADLFLPEKPGEHFTAVVTRTAGAIDAMSRTLLTELEVDNHEDKLFAGSFAQVRLEALRRSQLLTIPANALVFRQDGMQIAVVDTNNKVELRNFKPGRDLGYRLEVTEGVSANDRIILNPPDSLTAGVTVRLAPPSTGSKETK
jgi:RND family efflux transporter MFP subunit